jgi:dUTP pyrophosphatase
MMDNVTLYWTGEGERPTKSHPGDAGWDLFSFDTFAVGPKSLSDIRTGVSVALPHGYYGHIMGRSSTFRVHQLQVIEAVIDSGYRGELFFQVYNPGEHTVHVDKGRRLAQLIILPVPSVEWCRVQDLTSSSRGDRGFGSSGK